MASAVLPRRSEPYWGEQKVYMRNFATGKASAATDIVNPYPAPTPIPNPNPSMQIHGPSRPPVPSREMALPVRKQSGPTKESFHGGYATFRISTYTQREIRDLKKRLMSELEQVRALHTRFDALSCETRPIYSQIQRSGLPTTNSTISKQPNPTPRSAQAKKKGMGPGSKRSNPFAKGPNPKLLAMDPQAERVLSITMKRCRQMLTKVMRHKFAWVFNKPVDVERLGLFDYHQIIKKPMDLGTVKLNLEKGVYKSPVDFAADVRLTFDNAMTYNPKQHDVHIMAQQLLVKFNELFDPVYKKYDAEQLRILGQNPILVPLVKQQQVQPGVGKLSKPKARDENKRGMGFEEKAKLGKELEELPVEKMAQLVQIVRKRNGHLGQDGDEIELDMEAMDVETLWELDRFVTNHKKMLNKSKRQGFPLNQTAPILPIIQMPVSENVDVGLKVVEEIVDVGEKVMEKNVDVDHQKVVEEDVDIGEEIPVGNYPPVEIDKDVTAACTSGRSSSSSSSSSGSDSSSSSDSDTGSSSGSDTDVGSVQTP